MCANTDRTLVDAAAPNVPTITAYDELRFPIYIRLLDANAAGVSWEDAANKVLGLDVAADPSAAWRTWQSHLDRAQWMTEVGYRQLLR